MLGGCGCGGAFEGVVRGGGEEREGAETGLEGRHVLVGPMCCFVERWDCGVGCAEEV